MTIVSHPIGPALQIRSIFAFQHLGAIYTLPPTTILGIMPEYHMDDTADPRSGPRFFLPVVCALCAGTGARYEVKTLT